MAIRKSAPKKAGKKPARPSKKSAAKPKAAAARKADTARGGEAAAGGRASKRAAGKAEAPKKTAATTRTAGKSAPAARSATKAASKAAQPAASRGKATPRAASSARKAAAQKSVASAAPKAPPARRQKATSKSADAAQPAAPARKASRAAAGPPRTVAVTVGSEIASKLGRKWSCFQCEASFYDLNRPEPLCPKCGADQRQRPKVTTPAAAHPPAPRKQPRPMAPLLDDEDDGTVRYDEEFDLGVRTEVDDTEPDLFAPGEAEDEDVFAGDDD